MTLLVIARVKLCIVSVLSLLICPASAQDTVKEVQDRYVLRTVGSVQKADGHTTLVLYKDVAPALLGLDGFSHVWVLWWFDQNDTPEKRAVLQVHPRGNRNNPLTGVFACRSPARPNLIAVTLCRVLSVKDNIVEIDTIDAFAGSPILDLKPYIPGYDSAKATVPGWLKAP